MSVRVAELSVYWLRDDDTGWRSMAAKLRHRRRDDGRDWRFYASRSDVTRALTKDASAAGELVVSPVAEHRASAALLRRGALGRARAMTTPQAGRARPAR